MKMAGVLLWTVLVGCFSRAVLADDGGNAECTSHVDVSGCRSNSDIGNVAFPDGTSVAQQVRHAALSSYCAAQGILL